MKARPFNQWLWTALILLLFGNNGIAQGKNGRPNILWITCEDMSLHLSSFGETHIRTPNLDALASDGIKFTNVYTVAGVCAPSRNGIITGMYPQSIGGDNMRNFQPGGNSMEMAPYGVPVSYSIVPPSYVKCFPEFLRKENYYCTNSPKEDYQFEAPVTAWDESSRKAHWKNGAEGKPFFAVFNLNVSHESQLWLRDSLPLEVDPAKVDVPPYYPDNAETRRSIARQLSNVLEMDRQAGKLIRELKDAGLYDNTIIFFFQRSWRWFTLCKTGSFNKRVAYSADCKIAQPAACRRNQCKNDQCDRFWSNSNVVSRHTRSCLHAWTGFPG